MPKPAEATPGLTSRITAQGQISIPAAIRRRLGLEPGSVVEWEDQGDRFAIKRGGQYTFDDIHSFLFPDGHAPGLAPTTQEMDEAIRQQFQKNWK